MAMGTERARETVRRLQRDITSGRWPLNSRIPTEPELATELGVGRSTVREAVRSLAHLGMLEPAPGRGTFVRSLNPVSTVLADFAGEHSPADLLQLRQALEVQAAHQAALHADPDQVARLRSAHLRDTGGDLGQSTLDESIVETGRTPGQFHRSLIEVGGNPLLIELYDALMTAIRAAQRRGAVNSPESDEQRHCEHSLLLEAIAAGNPVAAVAAATQHASRDLVTSERAAHAPEPTLEPEPGVEPRTRRPRTPDPDSALF